jgi:hypothetical protein
LQLVAKIISLDNVWNGSKLVNKLPPAGCGATPPAQSHAAVEVTS